MILSEAHIKHYPIFLPFRKANGIYSRLPDVVHFQLHVSLGMCMKSVGSKQVGFLQSPFENKFLDTTKHTFHRVEKISFQTLCQALAADVESMLGIFSQQWNQTLGMKQLFLGSSGLSGWQGRKKVHLDLSTAMYAN